ncbi:MAG: hypothetical protein IPM51_12290 [Sphingobacteriaceae bacterium]|nr:hypothetical protein [Sphingobacteriaceae bacterium]
MLKKNCLIISLILLFLSVNKSQAQDSSNMIEAEQTWFIGINAGMQMSGYKSEDFISSNYSPLFNFTAGKWFSPLLALQIGYKGFYFYSISDDLKHHYNFLYGEAVLNLNNAIDPERSNKDWSLLLHTGVGYFYNHSYGKPNTCVNIGFQNTYQIANQFHA